VNKEEEKFYNVISAHFWSYTKRNPPCCHTHSFAELESEPRCATHTLAPVGALSAQIPTLWALRGAARKALRGGIRASFLEPLPRAWSRLSISYGGH